MKKTFILTSVCEFVDAVHQASASLSANQLKAHTNLSTFTTAEMEK